MLESTIQKAMHRVMERTLTPEKAKQVARVIMRKMEEEKLIEKFLMTARAAILEVTGEEEKKDA